ncbi:zinc-binding dehydrogenase, partial [Vibrio parahaemolyticus]
QPARTDVQGREPARHFVGSAGMADRLNAFVDAHAIKPVIDRTFAIADARAAWAYQSSPELFGKVVITL